MSITEEKIKFYKVKNGQVWLKSFLHFSERLIVETEDELEKAIEKFHQFKVKVENVLDQIDKTSNKGSFLVKLQNFKKEIEEIKAIGDFEIIYNKLIQYEEEIINLINQNKLRNLDLKKELIEEAKILSESTKWKAASEELKELRMRWNKIGAPQKEYIEKLETEFQSYFDTFYNKKKEFYKNSQKNVEEYKNLIENSKKAVLEKNEVLLKSIQKQWKELPPIPKFEYSKLFTELQKIHNDFFETLKREKVAKAQVKSKELKKQLIEEVKYLLNNTPKDFSEKVKQIRVKWKKTAPLSPEDSEKMWFDFNFEIDKLFESEKLKSFEKKLDSIKPEELFKEKTKYLKRKIRFEKEELSKMIDNIGTFRINHKSRGFSSLMNSKSKTKETKVQALEYLLKNLQNQKA